MTSEENTAAAPTGDEEEEDLTSIDAGSNAGTIKKIPLLSVNAGPRDGDEWKTRLREELKSLITYVKMNKSSDNDWFLIEPSKQGTVWSGKCWFVHDMKKHCFRVEFELPVAYPMSPFAIRLPELDGMTSKMYTGGRICLSAHFEPQWQRNAPKFGIAHALALGLGPWLAAEIPVLAAAGKLAEFES